MELITINCPECQGKPNPLASDHLGEGYRVCSQCKQEWWTYIDYSEKDSSMMEPITIKFRIELKWWNPKSVWRFFKEKGSVSVRLSNSEYEPTLGHITIFRGARFTASHTVDLRGNDEKVFPVTIEF